MKKFISVLVCAVLSVLCVFGLSACGDGTQEGAVNLLAVDATEVGVRNDVDYYVVAEPAASAKVNAIQALNFSGDLQALYGGENGYPQAVVVAKKAVAESSAAQSFITALKSCGDWLKSESTSPETIVNAVQSHLGEGMSPTFNAKNLTKQVVENCSVNFTEAWTCKQDIIDIIQSMNAVSETSFGTPAEAFFMQSNANSSADYAGDISVYMPDGAPALGFAGLMAGEVKNGFTGAVDYNVVNASVIQTFVAGANPKADICVLPVNLAVKLLGSGEKYTLLGTLTHGNLFLVSNGNQEISVKNLKSLTGKTVGVVNLAAVPGIMFKIILKNNGIDFTELK